MALGTSGRVNHVLHGVRLNASYLFDRLVGARLSWFYVTGTSGTVLYALAPLTASASGSPTSDALQAELDVNPWLNTRIGVQYTGYLLFNGAKTNYDGSGRPATANNATYAFVWLAF